jgi:hypothetical protein
MRPNNCRAVESRVRIPKNLKAFPHPADLVGQMPVSVQNWVFCCCFVLYLNWESMFFVSVCWAGDWTQGFVHTRKWLTLSFTPRLDGGLLEKPERSVGSIQSLPIIFTYMHVYMMFIRVEWRVRYIHACTQHIYTWTYTWTGVKWSSVLVQGRREHFPETLGQFLVYRMLIQMFCLGNLNSVRTVVSPLLTWDLSPNWADTMFSEDVVVWKPLNITTFFGWHNAPK